MSHNGFLLFKAIKTTGDKNAAKRFKARQKVTQDKCHQIRTIYTIFTLTKETKNYNILKNIYWATAVNTNLYWNYLKCKQIHKDRLRISFKILNISYKIRHRYSPCIASWLIFVFNLLICILSLQLIMTLHICNQYVNHQPFELGKQLCHWWFS